MAETIFPKGIRVFKPRDNAPDFVLGSVVISLNELVQFGKDNPDLLTDYNGTEQLKLNALKSKDGAFYFAVDTWKPSKNSEQVKSGKQQVMDNQPPPPETDDLPF